MGFNTPVEDSKSEKFGFPGVGFPGVGFPFFPVFFFVFIFIFVFAFVFI